MEYVHIQNRSVPALGLGTWQLTGDECTRSVLAALEEGYRHIDTAQMYENEEEVGHGIAQSDVPRTDIFLTTKILPDNLAPADVTTSVSRSLERLRMEYVDLLLIHWPSREVPLEETLDAMVDLQSRGWARHLGVSNFTPSLVKQAAAHAEIVCNQVEYHPFLSQDDLVEQARKMGHMLTAYSPLARGKVLEDPTLKAVGEAHNKSPAQVALRWLIQQDSVAAIPKASSDEHRRANLDIFDFQLSDDEMGAIHSLRRNERLINPPEFAPAWEHH